jgi:DNA-directed RNA polymerase II subunit RPB2
MTMEKSDHMLSNLGDYVEEPFTIIESYFKGQHLERLVRHQIESYNHFVSYQVKRTIEMFNPVVIHSENDYIKENDKYLLEVLLYFENFKVHPPQIHENNGATKTMLPQEAKLRNFTYASTMTIDIQIQYIIRNTEKMDNPTVITKRLTKINIGKMPIMIKSCICTLSQMKHVSHIHTGECPMDSGGYFIIKGSEKTVLGQERAAENRVYCFDGKNTTKWLCYGEIKSVPDNKCISPKHFEVLIANKNNGFGYGIFVNIPRIKNPIELVVLFRAFGIMSDKQICKYIVYDIDNKQGEEILNFLQASIIEANKYLTQEDALRHIVSSVMYTPLNMDKETGAKKKHDFAMDVLENDIFPHCRTKTQKLYFLGYMTSQVIQTALGWREKDDRDSYTNKRIELTGTLINNLFRNYFNKMVKEIQKQVVREINNGSWRSSEDYENIINMTNIYKIVKTTTIENGITRALATGDFSIKQMNSTKVGVAQVLNRLTYMSSLSHLRRINTPLEKSGELVAPRKLHNTTWGFLCPAETPEGQSIGVVKAISYMTHITIPTNSESLYTYIDPYIYHLDSIESESIVNNVKVFVNGCWIGMAKDPVELYREMKNKKHRGIINIYTSIMFDCKRCEIRICDDGGRLTRPLLRVENGDLLITKEIVDKLGNDELSWNDMLISAKLDESVIEYIDPDEQETSLIYMKSKDALPNLKLYTHCEIHPSTIFGVLASCTPFPDHNQAPRNTYQCAMAKQAVGVYAMNYDNRMDKTSYVLTYPTRPLVDTRLMNFIQLNRIPSGTQIHVAIMTHTGYNQEDSVLVNKASIDRGLFSATIYHTERDEDNNIIRDEIIRCKPDPTKTKGIKFGNYNKLNSNGFIPENTMVNNRDVIIAKTIPIKENRNDHTKVIKYEDQSVVYSTSEETYIDKNYTGRNGDGYNFAKVRVRNHRKPVYGDKFCALPTQQVLTSQGWVEIQNITKKHKVCTLGMYGTLHYEHPSELYNYDHDDEMYNLRSKHLEITCTMNHKLYVKMSRSDYTLIEAKDVMNKQARFQKTMRNRNEYIYDSIVENMKVNMNNMLLLLGIYIYCGKLNTRNLTIQLHISNTTLIQKVVKVLDEMSMIYKVENSGKVIIDNENLYTHFYQIQYKKKLPKYVWEISETQCRVLIETLYNDLHVYHTKNEWLAHELTKLALHCAYSAHVEESTLYEERSNETIFLVHLNKNENQPYINKHKDLTKREYMEHYKGKVYCIEMPSSHTYYMRETSYSPPCIVGNSSRHGQKGTCGNIIPECDMPFTKDGLRPDIIINPHAIPSRMTIGQLKETLLGKVLLELGMFGDGTSFGNLDINTISQRLSELNYESYGNEIMYDGLTGEQMETSIFIGPVFYQRLKHMVNDKVHSRASGPMVNLTRQPMEGRSRAGGLRVGEMERDVLISHGATRFCKERLFDVSDKYSVHICKKCGMMATYNDGQRNNFYSKSDFTIYQCRTCDNKTDFSLVEMPYANKLLFQELQTINVVPRIIT